MATVNMSLDEIIRKTKATRSGPRGGGGGSGGEAGKRSFGSKNRERGNRNFPSAATRGSGIEGKWKHDLFHEMQTVERSERRTARAAPKTVVTSTKSAAPRDARISISNLPQDIIDLDLEEMFQPFNFQRVQVNYNSEGISLGTADVFFNRATEAARAIKEFSGASLDGTPLKMVLLAEGGVPSIADRLSVPKSAPSNRSGGAFRREGGDRGERKNLRSPINGRINKKKRTSANGGLNKAGRFLDRLADDEDFKKTERNSKKLQDLDRELDEYMSHNKKQGGAATKMEE